MKKLQTKSGKFNFIHYFLTIFFLSLTSFIMAQSDKTKTAEDIEFERQAEEYQKQLTQQCTDKMLQLLRDAPIVVEGIFHEEEMERSVGMIGSTKYRFFCLKVIVNQVLKGNPILKKDTLYFTRKFVPLDSNGNEIYMDHGFSPGLYPNKPIILMLKPNDDVNSPFYNASRVNYIAYDAVQPCIRYDFFREGRDENNPKLTFRYIIDNSYCSNLLDIKEVNKLTKDIPNLKPIQKKSPESVSLRSTPTISNITPLETTAGTGSIITISGSGFGSQKGYIKFKNANNGDLEYLSNLDSIYIKSWSDTEIKVEVPGVVYKGHINEQPRPLAASGKIDVVTVSNGHKESNNNQVLNIKYSHRVEPKIEGGVLKSAKPVYLATRNCINGIKFLLHTSMNGRTDAIRVINIALRRWEEKLNIPLYLGRNANDTDYEYTSSTVGNIDRNVIAWVDTFSVNSNVLMGTSSWVLPNDVAGGDTSYYSRQQSYIGINGNTNWEYDTLGNVASNKRDFLNNILHEIGHALQLNHDVDLSRGTSSAEVRKNLMHFGNSGNVSQSNRPNLYQWSGRAIEGDTIMRNISMTKQWNALNTHTLACNPPKDYDILIEDHPQDVGREPYWGPDDMWTSQSIWVRNEDDTIRIHENPIYNPSSDTAFVYVKAKNIGCLEVPSGEVQLYWSKASTGLEWPINWKDTTITPRVQGRIHPLYDYHARLLDIDPGEYKIIRYLWKVPDPEDYDDKLHHVCLLAKTSSDDIPINYAIDSTKLWDIVPRNSEIAWKNLSIVPPPDTGYYTKPTTVWLRPILPKILNTQVTIRVSSSKSDITLGGDVILHLKGNLYDKWINRTGKDAPTILGGQKIKINANNTDLIFNNVAQYDIYSIDVIYYANPLMAQSVQFNVDLKQIENTILVGGERFEIRSSSLYTPPTPLLSNKEEEKPNIRFEISPNPVASDTDLYADIDLMNYKATFLQVKIIKIDGNVLSTSKVVQGRNTLHTDRLLSGTYIAILFDGTKVLSSKRFVVL